MPKRIVLTTWGSFGDLHPYMAIAIELRRRGHAAVIATLPGYREKVERAGVGFRPLRPDVPQADESIEIVRRILDARDGPRYVFETLLGPAIREIYDDTMAAVEADGGADLLVSHPLTLTTPIAAARAGIPWVSTALAPISFFSAHDPPSPPQWPALRQLVASHPALGRAFVALGRRVTRPWVAPVARLRETLGLPPGAHPLFEGQHSPHLVLGLFSDLFGPMQRDFPPKTRLTGFPFYDTGDATGLAPELARFLDEGEPPILFTLGSSAVWVAGDFYRTSVEAARRLGRRALLLVGDRRNLPAVDLPDGVAAFDYVPYDVVMPRAAVIVHQGGVGTTAQALRAGRPVLIRYFGHDTPDNARRAVALGTGRSLSASRYTAPRVAKALADLLANPSYAARAARAGERIRAENGAAAACDAIESLLAISASRSAPPHAAPAHAAF